MTNCHKNRPYCQLMKTPTETAQLLFQIEYHTDWGFSLQIHLFSDQGDAYLPMTWTEGDVWQIKIDRPTSSEVTYRYEVIDEGGHIHRTMKALPIALHQTDRHIAKLCDHWADEPIDEVFLHTAFSDCVFNPCNTEALAPIPADGDKPHRLVLEALTPPRGCHWAVLGSSQTLGEWNEKAVRPLVRTGIYTWETALTDADLDGTISYKYVLLQEEAEGRRVTIESGDNRLLPHAAGDCGVIVVDHRPRITLAPWRGAGVVVPVFSLRSDGSQGIGDFGDLKRFVDWAAAVGLRAVQILPINDTTSSGTWRDSYPYNGVSVFALHPVYLDMRAWADLPVFENFKAEAQRLNALPEVDYESVFKLKMDFLSALYSATSKRALNASDYLAFVRENKYWLQPYAEFMKAKMSHFNPARIHDVEFYYFVQHLLHRQMLAAHDEARACGVIIKGDIPIGVCHDSVPATASAHLFHLDGQAGAPPDAFAAHGQNWGFPTYDWEAMKADGYDWWQRRLTHMSHYFDAYRIDHVLGFFRIWEVPADQIWALMGRFRPALPLTDDDIRGYGFTADARHYTVPRISAQRFKAWQEEMGDVDLSLYFEKECDGWHALRPAYRSTRHTLETVADKQLRERLMQTACEVLFVCDAETDRLHPRIQGFDTDVFGSLSQADREAYYRLHNDFFYFRHNHFWAEGAVDKLRALTEARRADSRWSMLACAEDLGMVPASVPEVLARLNILSLEIQRMPKAFGVRFGRLEDNPYLSVATIATHDMPPLRLWWDENREQTQAFWTDALGHEGDAPAEATPEVCEEVVARHLACPSMLCLIALQDFLGIDAGLRRPDYINEQINVPANPDQYWCYRMHITLDTLIRATHFNEKLRALVKRSGR